MTDTEDKTEAPTEKRLLEAATRGDVSISREALIAVSVCGLAIEASMMWPSASGGILASLAAWMSDVSKQRLTGSTVMHEFASLAISSVWICILPIIVFRMVLGVAANSAQIGIKAIPDRIAPKIERISPFRNIKRLFDKYAFGIFAVNVAKIIVAATMIIIAVVVNMKKNNSEMFVDPNNIGQRLVMEIEAIALKFALLMTVIAVADIGWSKWRWLKNLYMTRAEIKDEIRRSEGDQSLKARIRSVTLARNRAHMISAIESATLVVVNPTHYAVALRYVQGVTVAPIVLAKGRDLIALKIRRRAIDLDIPVIEDKELARSLYQAVVVDHAIPREFYRSIAGLIHLIRARASVQIGGGS